MRWRRSSSSVSRPDATWMKRRHKIVTDRQLVCLYCRIIEFTLNQYLINYLLVAALCFLQVEQCTGALLPTHHRAAALPQQPAEMRLIASSKIICSHKIRAATDPVDSGPGTRRVDPESGSTHYPNLNFELHIRLLPLTPKFWASRVNGSAYKPDGSRVQFSRIRGRGSRNQEALILRYHTTPRPCSWRMYLHVS